MILLKKFGRNIQKLTSTILEGIIGQAKEYHDMGKVKLRGISKVEIQFLLIAIAINLKKMVKMTDNSPIFQSLIIFLPILFNLQVLLLRN